MVKKANDRINVSINQILKRQFTAVCALKGLNMSEVVEALIAEWLEENATPKLLAALTEEEEVSSPTRGQERSGERTPKKQTPSPSKSKEDK